MLFKKKCQKNSFGKNDYSSEISIQLYFNITKTFYELKWNSSIRIK